MPVIKQCRNCPFDSLRCHPQSSDVHAGWKRAMKSRASRGPSIWTQPANRPVAVGIKPLLTCPHTTSGLDESGKVGLAAFLNAGLEDV